MEKDKLQLNVLWNLRWLSFLQTINFGLTLSVMVVVLTVGVRMSYSETLVNAQETAQNVRVITRNMIPVSEVTAKEALRNNTGNSSLADAATQAMMGISQADWPSFLGNVTNGLRAFTNINFSLLTQMSLPEYQSVIREQVDHAFATIDYVNSGVSELYKTFEAGYVSKMALS
jgi:hypothetical protein